MRYAAIGNLRDFTSPFYDYGRGVAKDDPYLLERQRAIAEIVVPAILSAGSLRDSNPTIRCEAAWRLNDLGFHAISALPELLERLSDEDEKVRTAAAQAVGSIGRGTSQAISRLSMLLADVQEVRDSAIGALMSICSDPRFLIPYLLEDLDKSREVTRTAIHRLSRIGPPAKDAIPKLLCLLQEASDWETAAAARKAILSIIRNLNDLSSVILALGCSDRQIKEAAVGEIGRFGAKAKEVIPSLIALLASKEEPISDEAVRALTHIGPCSIPPLVETLREDNKRLVLQACKVLVHFGPKSRSAIPLLQEQLAMGCHKQPNFRSVVTSTIQRINVSRLQWLKRRLLGFKP